MSEIESNENESETAPKGADDTEVARREPAPDEATRPATATPRRILAGFFWLIASLAIMVSGVTLWAHQTLLTSNGWTSIVSDIASDEEVLDNASSRIVDRLSESLGVQEKLVEILPGEMNLVAGAITGAVEDRVAGAVADFASRDEVQDAFINVNRVAHDAAMKAIRGGDGEALTSSEGTISLNVFPIVEGALVALKDAGFIDEDRSIPDLSGYEPAEENVERLETLLGRELPDDIGTITLIESDRLDRAQTAVRNFDVITIALILLAVAAVILALWLSARRVRMVLWLAIGAIVALLLGRGFTRLVLEDVTGALRTAENGDAVRAVVETAVDSLMWFTFAIIVVALVVAALAIWYERREAVERGEVPPEPQTARGWLRSRARLIGYVGGGLVAFFVLWNVGGPDITLLAAGLVGIILIAVSLLAGRDDGSEAAIEGQGG